MFHGITGLLAENKDLPQISRGIEHHNSKQILHSPTQEMYRRTFAAQWRVQAGELAPGDVVEDIFKGGSGWTTELAPSVPKLPDRTSHRRTDTVTVQTRDTRPQQTRRPSGRYNRSQIPFHRPMTPLSPDDQSDDDDDEADGWNSRPELESRRMNHLRTSSIVSITPQQGRNNRQQRNVITSESWEREELEVGRRSWVIPDLNAVEEKIEKRRLARESRSTNTSSASFASAPGSSGKYSSTTDKSMLRSVSLNGSVVSEAIVEDDEDGVSANGAVRVHDTDDSG